MNTSNLTWMHLLLGVLATYRISLMATKESGPAHIFRKLRRVPDKHSPAHEWLSCIFCFSVTVSAKVCLLLYLAGVREPWPVWVLVWLAFSSGTILLNQKFTRGDL